MHKTFVGMTVTLSPGFQMRLSTTCQPLMLSVPVIVIHGFIRMCEGAVDIGMTPRALRIQGGIGKEPGFGRHCSLVDQGVNSAQRRTLCDWQASLATNHSPLQSRLPCIVLSWSCSNR